MPQHLRSLRDAATGFRGQWCQKRQKEEDINLEDEQMNLASLDEDDD